MSTDRVIEIIVEHTRVAVLASNYAEKLRFAKTEEEAKYYFEKKESCKKRIEELRKERKNILGK